MAFLLKRLVADRKKNSEQFAVKWNCSKSKDIVLKCYSGDGESRSYEKSSSISN